MRSEHGAPGAFDEEPSDGADGACGYDGSCQDQHLRGLRLTTVTCYPSRIRTWSRNVLRSSDLGD